MAYFTPEIYYLVISLGLGGSLARTVFCRLDPYQSIVIKPYSHDFTTPAGIEASLMRMWADG